MLTLFLIGTLILLTAGAGALIEEIRLLAARTQRRYVGTHEAARVVLPKHLSWGSSFAWMAPALVLAGMFLYELWMAWALT